MTPDLFGEKQHKDIDKSDLKVKSGVSFNAEVHRL